MTSLEIKISVSGEHLETLRALAGNLDDVAKIRQTARMIFFQSLDNMKIAVSACLEGEVGDIDVEGKDE